jgi:pimeloyl-ACP methyl ester carboxylesterase
MSQCRSSANLIGNGLATVVVSRRYSRQKSPARVNGRRSHFMKLTFFPIGAVVFGLAMAVIGCVNASPIPTGMSRMEVGDGANAITVFTYKPRSYHNGPLVMVFHGVLRNAEDYCRNCIPLAEHYRVLIAAPLFSTNQYDNEEYQRGGVIKKGVVQPREDWTYLRLPGIIRAIQQREDQPALPYYFIGHSGGAQFLMRLAAIYPMEAKRIVACNPGSDLFPRRDWKFGYGFGGLPDELSDDAALQRYLAAPLTLCLGMNDIDPRHPELDRSAAAELEGRFRLERGRACFAFAQKLAQAHGWKFNWRKLEVPGIAHDGKAMLAAKEVQAAIFAGENNPVTISR